MHSEYQETNLVLAAYKGACQGRGDAVDCILGLEPHCFEGLAPGAIWSVMRTLILKGKQVSEAGIRLELARAGELGPDGIYWGSYRELLMGGIDNPQPLHTLREGVKDSWVRREMARICDEKRAELVDPTVAGIEVANAILGEVEAITTDSGKASTWADITDRFNTSGQIKDEATTQGAWSGLGNLDVIYPFPAKGMTVVAARPNVGKSMMALTILDATIKHGNKVVWINMDMAEDIARAKMVSCISGVPYDNIMNGWCKGDEVSRVKVALEMLGDMVEFVHFPAFTSFDKVKATTSQALRRTGATCMILDQFSQIGVERKYGDKDHTKRAYVSTSYKNLAQTFGVAAIVLAQINRQGADGEPGLQDLAETGSLEADASGVLLLWPKADGKIDSPGGSDLSFGNQQKVVKFQNSDNVLLRLAKSQIGPVGHTMLLKREGAISRFTHIERYT